MPPRPRRRHPNPAQVELKARRVQDPWEAEEQPRERPEPCAVGRKVATVVLLVVLFAIHVYSLVTFVLDLVRQIRTKQE